VVTPDGAEWAPRPLVDNAMVNALARASRWRKMLDEGVYATIEELARAKGVAPSYVSRLLRLILLAPEMVEPILDGRQPAGLQLDDVIRLPLDWKEQLYASKPHFWTSSGEAHGAAEGHVFRFRR
jgi:hypothetical protein